MCSFFFFKTVLHNKLERLLWLVGRSNSPPPSSRSFLCSSDSEGNFGTPEAETPIHSLGKELEDLDLELEVGSQGEQSAAKPYFSFLCWRCQGILFLLLILFCVRLITWLCAWSNREKAVCSSYFISTSNSSWALFWVAVFFSYHILLRMLSIYESFRNVLAEVWNAAGGGVSCWKLRFLLIIKIRKVKSKIARPSGLETFDKQAVAFY